MWNTSTHCCPISCGTWWWSALAFHSLCFAKYCRSVNRHEPCDFVPLIRYAEVLLCWSTAVVEVFLLSYLVTCMPVFCSVENWVSLSGMVQSSAYMSLKGARTGAFLDCTVEHGTCLPCMWFIALFLPSAIHTWFHFLVIWESIFVSKPL